MQSTPALNPLLRTDRSNEASEAEPTRSLPNGVFKLYEPNGRPLTLTIKDGSVDARFAGMNESLYPSSKASDVVFKREGDALVAHYSEGSGFGAWEWYNRSSYQARDYKMELHRQGDRLLVDLETTSSTYVKKGALRFEPRDERISRRQVLLTAGP